MINLLLPIISMIWLLVSGCSKISTMGAVVNQVYAFFYD